MQEQLISFKTARLAKEKGYPQLNEGIYFTKDKEYCLVGWGFDNVREYSAPTQSLLARWLRETHDCHVYIRPEPYSMGINFNWQVLFYDGRSITCWDDRSTGLYGDNGEYQTYESAMEAALQKALELITKN